jgi:hypothetical protein
VEGRDSNWSIQISALRSLRSNILHWFSSLFIADGKYIITTQYVGHLPVPNVTEIRSVVSEMKHADGQG